MSEKKTYALTLDFKKYETRNYIFEVMKHNELISKKHKRICTTLSYIKDLVITVSTVTGYVSISAFPCLEGIPILITSSAVARKFVQQLLETKSISQYLIKRRGNMIKKYF